VADQLSIALKFFTDDDCARAGFGNAVAPASQRWRAKLGRPEAAIYRQKSLNRSGANSV
jgi:hypothetical protein